MHGSGLRLSTSLKTVTAETALLLLSIAVSFIKRLEAQDRNKFRPTSLVTAAP